MSASESDSGTLYGAFATAFSAGCDAMSSAIRTPAIAARRSSPSVRKLVSTSGLESGIGVRSFTQPRAFGLIRTGPKA